MRELEKLGIAWLKNDYQLGDRIRQLVDGADDAPDFQREEVRKQIADLREERIGWPELKPSVSSGDEVSTVTPTRICTGLRWRGWVRQRGYPPTRTHGWVRQRG
jgi:hypothetical protein